MTTKPALLALADGSLFYGVSIGDTGNTIGEVVFNTAMTGYQEILTDPSYAGQIVTLTVPHIGNTGTNAEDHEAERLFAAGLIIRSLSLIESSWRSQQSLSEYLKKHHVMGIAEIDTRLLTRRLRTGGVQSGCIMSGEINEAVALSRARGCVPLNGLDLAKEVSVQTPYNWHEGTWGTPASFAKAKFKVVAYDFGVKHNTLRMLVDRGCEITVVPAKTSAEAVLAYQPDGIFLSNGPGDPAPCDYAILAIQQLLAKNIPLFGICLGHQLLALACGAKTSKMKFGHHGANHPVLCLAEKRVWITSQNHGFTVEEATLPNTLRVTHRSLFDGTVQGIAHTQKPAFAFQGHPEASPGPTDPASLFDQFIELMQKRVNSNHAKTN